jgi:hypothetical protein
MNSSARDDEMQLPTTEELLNRLLPGLQIFVRDINMSPEFINTYQPGMIIKERGFVDASARVGGMITSCRYAILSNHMKDLSSLEHGTNWGLAVASDNSYFKVIDVFQENGKTQITLLHLLNEEWLPFQNLELREPNLAQMSRDRFLAKYQSEPIAELTTEAWLDRCKYPVGLDDNSNPFPL